MVFEDGFFDQGCDVDARGGQPQLQPGLLPPGIGHAIAYAIARGASVVCTWQTSVSGPGLRTASRVGVVCPHIWVFDKIAYLPTPRPTMTTRLVQPKQPTHLPPPLRPMCMVKW